ncbi:MAG: hypothetical protein H7246_02590 [Phycisphaerae bacterium]|nr:hypothetical protein [Saprospiraceae bacterium]
MSLLNKQFYVTVRQNGSRHLLMDIQPSEFESLGAIVTDGYYVKIAVVEDVVIGLQSVVSGECESYHFGTEWCFIESQKETSVASNAFEYYKPFSIPTSEILLLMEEWLAFLFAYEKNEIPGLPYPPPSIKPVI